MRNLFALLRAQITIIGVLLALNILAAVGILPSPDELASDLANLLKNKGLPLIAVVSFIENLAGIGVYFPGSVVIAAAMALTAGNVGKALLVYFAIVIPAMAANIISYFIGKVTRKESIVPSKSIALWYAATYWHPQLAGVTAAASGAEGIPFWTYVKFFLPISISWTIFWALLLYFAGKAVDTSSLLLQLFYIYIAAWILWDIRKYFLTKKIKNRTTGFR